MVGTAPVNAGDDRSRRTTQLAKPRILSATPAATSMVVNFTTIANASSYTVRIIRSERVFQTFPNASTGGTFSNLEPLTKYKVTVRAIGSGNYVNSDESDEFTVTTTRLVSYPITWVAACPTDSCTPIQPSQVTYTAGQSIDSPYQRATTPGWHFNGWNFSLPLVVGGAPKVAAPYGELTITQQWALNPSHTVTWVLACPGGNSCGSTSGGSSTYTEGLGITYPTVDPSVTGWHFDGWSSDNPATISSPDTTPVSPYKNITFTAQWSANTYNVFWDSACLDQSACTVAAGGSSSYLTGQSIANVASDPDESGRTFAGWLSSNPSATTDPLVKPVSPYGDITFTAQWTAAPNTGGSGGGPTGPDNGGGPAGPDNGGGPTGPTTHTVTWVDNCLGCSGSARYTMTFNDGDAIGGDPRPVPGTSLAGSFANWVWYGDPTIDVWDLLAMIFHEDVVFEGTWNNFDFSM